MGYPHKIIIILVALTACCVTSCTNRKTTESLDRAESLMESAPDSAMTILSGIDRRQLAGEEQRARYALLMSMALDKNYIDTTAFDVLQPAIDYYLDYGTPDEKLRTYYYQGRIYQNAGHRDSALNCFTKAIDISPECTDSLVIARALVAQAFIFNEYYDLRPYISNNLDAARIYHELSMKKLEFDCLLNALNGYVLLEDSIKADSLHNICNKFNITDPSQQQLLLKFNLTYLSVFESKHSIRDYIEHLDKDVPLSPNSMINLAFAYHKSGDNNQAKRLLDSIIGYKLEYDTLKFQSVAISVLEQLGNHREALAIYKNFTHRLDSLHSLIFKNTTLAIKEKHEIELNAQKEARYKSQIIWGCLAGIIILIMSIGILLLLLKSNKTKKALALEKVKAKELENNRLKSESEKLSLEKQQLILKAENLALQVEKLETESNNLKTIIDAHEELPQEIQLIIKERIEMLNSLLASYISTNEKYEKPYNQWIKRIADNTETFMNSGRLAFMASHPNFIKYFEEHGLTIEEINYVCLYAIGLNGKEVGGYMKKPSHVNMSSAIRRKLGLDKHETNLGIYVRNLLKNL